MFLLSRLILLGALVTGVSSISAYLINYSKENLKTLFKASTSEHNSQEIKKFKNKEIEKLEKLNPSFDEMKEARDKAKEFKQLKFEEMKKIFQEILKIENILISLYEENFKVLSNLIKTNEELFKQQEDKLNKDSERQKADYLISLITQINEMLRKQGDALGKFICAIENGEKENKDKKSEVNCERMEFPWKVTNSQNNISSESSSSAGGGGQLAHK